MNIVISGGGTGGHVYPAISIVEAIVERDPGANVLYIGSPGSLEEKAAKNASIDFHSVKSYTFYGKGIISKITSGFKMIWSGFSALKKMRQFGPDVVIGTGGYIIGPVMFAAVLLRKKIFLHEQNVIPGMANSFFAKFANKVFISYSESIDKFNVPREKLEITGNPTRDVFHHIDKAKERKNHGLDNEFVILSLGGSGGCKSINDFLVNSKEFISSKENFKWIHVTGAAYYDKYFDKLKGIKNLEVHKYLDNISSYYAISDVIICRSGAITLAEISAVGMPSILVPSPNVANDHQTENAKVYKKEGASFIVNDKKLNDEFTYKLINDLINDPELRQNMADNSKRLALLGASSIIADRVILGE